MLHTAYQRRVQAVELPSGASQLNAGSEFVLTISGRRAFGDVTTGIWFTEATFEEFAYDDNLIQRRLTTLVKITEFALDSGVNILDAAVVAAAGARLPAPQGFRRTGSTYRRRIVVVRRG